MAGEKEERAAREELLNQYRNLLRDAENDEVRFGNLLQELDDKWLVQRRAIRQAYPPDPPHAKCHHAVITGLALENSTWVAGHESLLPKKGDLVRLFTFGFETIYIWTHAEDEYSLLLVDVDPSVAPGSTWRTSAAALSLCTSLTALQEHAVTTGYAWIYNFDPKIRFAEQALLDEDDIHGLDQRNINTINYWFERAHVLELLLRSEPFFVSSQLLCDSFRSHWFCLECARRSIEHRNHRHDEPDPWNLASSIPVMESAILQATRAVEGLIGKPGKRVSRSKERWIQSIGLDPDAEFALVGKSYFEYYYDLFAIRADSAHSYGRLSPDLTRAMAVNAQTFADLVVFSLFERNAISVEEAQQRLSFDATLLANVDRGVYGNGGGSRTRKRT